MANYATLKAAIAAAIKQNGNNEITGNLLQQQLLAMISSLGVGYQWLGVATPETDPGLPDYKGYYFAFISGTYNNFGGAQLSKDSIGILYYDTSWNLASFSIISDDLLSLRLQAGYIVKDNLTESGYISLSDGSVGSGNYRHTPKIPVKKGEKISFYGDGGSPVAVLAAYNGNTYLGAKSVAGTYPNMTHEYIVPDGVDSVIISSSITTMDNFYCFVDKLNLLNVTIFGKTVVLDSGILENVGYISNNGDETSMASYRRSNRISVIGVDKIEFYSDSSGVVSALAAYSNNVFSGENSILGVGAPKDFVYKVPDGIDEIVISTSLSSSANFYCRLYKIGLDESVDYLNSKFPADLDKAQRISGNLTSNGFLYLDDNNIKTNKILSFVSKITSFTKMAIGHGTAYDSAFIEIDRTNIIYYRHGSVYGDPIPHGLTIENTLCVRLEVGEDADCKCMVSSNGVAFNTTLPLWYGCRGSIFAKAIIATLSNCELSWTCDGYSADIQLYGDSYLGHVDDVRWPYYLIRDGFGKNVLLDGYGGKTSASAIETFVLNIQHSAPRYVAWLMGMNDGDNSDSINASWLSCVQKFLTMCESNHIIPILSTIPNTPTVNNQYKNQWVRSSGYRYIDFDKAVHENIGDTSWYNGMLSSDNVHPTATGAISLYMQVLVDFPEIANGK